MWGAAWSTLFMLALLIGMFKIYLIWMLMDTLGSGSFKFPAAPVSMMNLCLTQYLEESESMSQIVMAKTVKMCP